jgi:hypothetical protein
MPKYLFALLFLVSSITCFAQKRLLFYNTKTLKTIELKEGHRASILYKGYMGQLEVMIHTVTQITDSTITLGSDFSGTPFATKPGKIAGLSYKTIRITDIEGFRRMTVGRQLARSGVNIIGIVGSYYLLRNVYTSNISGTGAFFISLGTGLGIVGITKLLFPENIKYYMEDGWQVKVVED